MRRRKAAKTQRPNTLKRRNAPKVTRHRKPLAADANERIALLTRERDEALEQQTATSEVLKIISSSPGELEPVFSKMLENAARICEAKFGTLVLAEGGGRFRVVAMHGAPSKWAEKRTREPVFTPGPLNNVAIVTRTQKVRHVPDLRLDRSYLEQDQAAMALADIAGARTLIVVPLIKNDEVIGIFGIYRQEVRPFTEKQIELVQNFAAQAVIAIENTRLLTEIRQRSADLSESLEQQTATSEVLKVISSSPGELEPVFNATLENATRICEAKFGILWLYDGELFRLGAWHGVPSALADFHQQRGAFRPSSGTPLYRLLQTGDVVHSADELSEPTPGAAARYGGARSLVAVPMTKENKLVGAFIIYRQEVRPFTDKQIELVKNFASQAVIAIENTRLLNELRQRTGDLSEALEQQTATSEVLKVISSSRGQLEPVFQAILANATRICEAKFGTLFRWEGDALQTVAMHDAPQAFADERRRNPVVRPAPATTLARALATKKPVQDADALNQPQPGALVNLAGARTILSVPMLRENELVGAFSIFRQEVRPFTDKQIELLQNFAAQAVIAIENARLLNDLNKLNQQLEQRVTDQVSEIERMGRLRRFLPAQVADLIVASGTEKQLESHRREITALFCDLRGFTGFSESSDPEDVMALLREYHAAIGEIINKYGGTLERYAGDGVMVVFNDPIPVDNPALQAVLMAIDMRAAIGMLIEKWRKLGHDIGFGIGIAHGFATLGTIGFEGRFDYAAIGTVSNVASRLCDEAKPGQILISSRVLMAVEKNITVEPVGDFALKGIRRPMTAYNVLAAKAAN